jgi:hypothetical protein
LNQWRLAVERARYDAERAERQYRAVEPETDWLRAAWKRSGRNACAISRLPKRNCSVSPAIKSERHPLRLPGFRFTFESHFNSLTGRGTLG